MLKEGKKKNSIKLSQRWPFDLECPITGIEWIWVPCLWCIESEATGKGCFNAKKMHLTNCSDGMLQKWGKSCRGGYFYNLKKRHTHTNPAKTKTHLTPPHQITVNIHPVSFAHQRTLGSSDFSGNILHLSCCGIFVCLFLVARIRW